MDTVSDSNERKPPESDGASKRNLRARGFVQLLRRRRGRLFVAFLIMLLLFAGIALAQHWFVHAQLYKTTEEELGAWASEVFDEIAFKDSWDLQGYRRASISAPIWFVVTKDGLIVDCEGFIPGLFGHVELPDESIYNSPQTVTTAVGEKWRIFGRKVTGGVVIVGLCSPENVPEADVSLRSNAAKFGATLAAAESTRSRDIDYDVDYASVSSSGELEGDWGGVPLRTDSVPRPSAPDRMVSFNSGGKPYMLFFRPILDSKGQEVGSVIIPKDMTLEKNALRAQDRFNIWVIGIASIIACVFAVWLVVQELIIQSKHVTLEEALRVGETRTVEFKGSFQWDLRQNRFVEERRLDTLKSIAAFLNGRGGTLFIGVTEDTNPPSPRGLEEDLGHAGNSKDKLQRTLRDLITARIGSEFSPLITDSLHEHSGRLYWRIAVEESPEPAFVRWKFTGETKEQKKFYVREGPKTSDLDIESSLHYIKVHWG